MAKKGVNAGRKKGSNKHASNLRRHERKYERVGGVSAAGNCGSSFCERRTGCEPWK